MPQVPPPPETPMDSAALGMDTPKHQRHEDHPAHVDATAVQEQQVADGPVTPLASPGGEQIWVSPGVSPRKRLFTALLILGGVAVFMFIAAHEGASMWVSTLIGGVFIGCFIWYLRIVAPAPFTLRLDTSGITRAQPDGVTVTIPWTELSRVKEEAFKNGTPISLSFYKRIGERGVFRAFVVYRDDIPRFDALLSAVLAALPNSARWQRETVHE